MKKYLLLSRQKHTFNLTLIFTLISIYTGSAWGCGGLFCNTSQPVVQSAERILFAPDPNDAQRIQMHVQIQYAGPPADFSWMLPVPVGTDFKLSTERLFNLLDARFAPQFRLDRETVGDCPVFGGYEYGYNYESAPPAPSNPAPPPAPPQVQVLSREIVGPYDKVLLTADTVGVLTDWLTENGYQVPDRAEDVLSPYLDNFAFIAIKLIPTEGVDSIRPIALNFASPAPSIPLIPTSVAAQPDMGILVHFLGESRAISTNYAHVQINEAVIDWLGRAGRNYTDVVSQAIDEANGQAFVTDFAGQHNLGANRFPVLSDDRLSAIESVTTLRTLVENTVYTYLNQTDFDSALRDSAGLTDEEWNSIVECVNYVQYVESLPEENRRENFNIDEDQYRQCTVLISDEERMIDGPAIAEALGAVSAIYKNLNQLFETHPYLTRLYSTLSAEEMTVDPSFSYNPDLSDVDRTRTATLRQTCEGERIELVLSNGQIIDLRNEAMIPTQIERQEGETVRGEEEIAAVIIERQMPAGQSEMIEDRTDAVQMNLENSDSGCQIGDPSWSEGSLVLLLMWSLLYRRRLDRA